jgi:hypothetical protein
MLENVRGLGRFESWIRIGHPVQEGNSHILMGVDRNHSTAKQQQSPLTV